MQKIFLNTDNLNLVISTAVLLFMGILLVFFLFRYQRKRFAHAQELFELRELFNQSLLQSKLEIQEHTIGHIARELHDNISPLISIIQISLGIPKFKKIPDISQEIAELRSNTNQLMTELKSISLTLNTDHIMTQGFAEALWQELNRLERTKLYNTVRTVTGEKFRLRPEHEIILFRICQELLNNIVKHAEAQNITVLLQYQERQFSVSISDDGKGYEVENTGAGVRTNSTGLINIAARAKLIGAKVETISTPGSGTATSITIPHI